MQGHAGDPLWSFKAQEISSLAWALARCISIGSEQRKGLLERDGGGGGGGGGGDGPKNAIREGKRHKAPSKDSVSK